MKKNVSLVAMLSMMLVFGLGVVSCATSGAKVTEPVNYSETVEVAGVSHADLYTRANMWFVDAFNNAESVIQFSDKESGVIKGKYIGDDVMAGAYMCRISATVTVEVKNGRYRISFDNPQYQYVGDVMNGRYARPGTSRTVETVAMAEKIKPEWEKLATNLKESVQSNKSAW